MFLRFVSLLIAIMLFGCESPHGNSAFRVVVNWNTEQLEKEARPVWLGYLMARANYIQEHATEYSGQVGVVEPHFTEEVYARTKAADIYDELGRNGHSPYFEDLLKVKKAGYMKEYVWTGLRQSSWTVDEEPKKLLDFDAWARKNIPNHRVVTSGSISMAKK